MRKSYTPTPWGVHCTGLLEGYECNGGRITYLTEQEYSMQLAAPNLRWRCPQCNAEAWWDDDNYEEYQ